MDPKNKKNGYLFVMLLIVLVNGANGIKLAWEPLAK